MSSFAKRLWAGAFLVLALGAAAKAASCPPADPQQIRDAYATWLAAYRSRDLAGVMAIFDDKVVFEFQGSPDQDADALRAGYVQEFAKRQAAQWAPAFDDVEASGDLGAAFSKWQLTAKAADGTTKVLATNNSVDFFRRNDACQWKIVRSLNYPLK